MVGMGDGGRADADQIDLAQKFAPVGHGQHAMLGGDGAADLGAGIGDGEKFDVRQWLGAILGGVMAAKGARADDGGLQRSLFRNAAAEKHRSALWLNTRLL